MVEIVLFEKDKDTLLVIFKNCIFCLIHKHPHLSRNTSVFNSMYKNQRKYQSFKNNKNTSHAFGARRQKHIKKLDSNLLSKKRLSQQLVKNQ